MKNGGWIINKIKLCDKQLEGLDKKEEEREVILNVLIKLCFSPHFKFLFK